jgi:hypothetical protein
MVTTNPNKLTAKQKANSENVKAKLARRAERQSNRNGTAVADWESADGDLVLKLIAIVGNLKGTLTFGYTKNGSAYYLNYYIEKQSEKVFIRPTEDLNESLLAEIESWE